jgi:hypothetical protein
MQFARTAIAIAAFFICFGGTPSFADSCSQMESQCVSIHGYRQQNLDVNLDSKKKRCAEAVSVCKTRCKQGFKGFVVPFTMRVEPVTSCD